MSSDYPSTDFVTNACPYCFDGHCTRKPNCKGCTKQQKEQLLIPFKDRKCIFCAVGNCKKHKKLNKYKKVAPKTIIDTHKQNIDIELVKGFHYIKKTKPVVEKTKPVVEKTKPVVEKNKPVVEKNVFSYSTMLKKNSKLPVSQVTTQKEKTQKKKTLSKENDNNILYDVSNTTVIIGNGKVSVQYDDSDEFTDSEDLE